MLLLSQPQIRVWKLHDQFQRHIDIVKSHSAIRILFTCKGMDLI